MAANANTSLSENATLLDIGANLGYYTLLFASKGHRVVAVEPMTRNRKALEGSICLNPQFKDRITVVPVALANQGEVADMRCVIKSTNYNWLLDRAIGSGIGSGGD